MRIKQAGFTLVELIMLTVYLATAIGWVWNIVKIVAAMSDPLAGMFILRCVGILVFPLGAVLGYL
ncbi:hypothetical protein E4H12_01975 [Candidatus Thorarchaeota archaeon]|nr:MAG: hypothetical protein E4H12_01975 [Candidatus Thorarchaeota archaeon]